MTPKDCTRTPRTFTTLWPSGMRRNDSRRAGTGMPEAWSRSVGNTSGSVEGSGMTVIGPAEEGLAGDGALTTQVLHFPDT